MVGDQKVVPEEGEQTLLVDNAMLLDNKKHLYAHGVLLGKILSVSPMAVTILAPVEFSPRSLGYENGAIYLPDNTAVDGSDAPVDSGHLNLMARRT